ncbi:hypothetical protein BKA70DRAFT_1220477 [Coprinopsis sp. MPI-PUGE-AT-0042]|nr:hypothetical protein BKA70DRAFT_1220477 [Coprinopsis sp. MPI-PUGE-AT-0042]
MYRNSERIMLDQLQRDMGLQDDSDRFEAFQPFTFLGLAIAARLCRDGPQASWWDLSKDAQQQNPKVLARLAWKVRDSLPFFHRYAGSNWPILFFLEIQLVSLQMEEAQFRRSKRLASYFTRFPISSHWRYSGLGGIVELHASHLGQGYRGLRYVLSLEFPEISSPVTEDDRDHGHDINCMRGWSFAMVTGL